jgi:hypothetical protein
VVGGLQHHRAASLGLPLPSVRTLTRERPHRECRPRWVIIMPRYYFHVRRDRVTILDHGGIELADSLEAAKEAVRRALQIEADAAMKDFSRSSGAIIVDDEFSTVLEVPFEGPIAALAAESGSVPATGR